MHLLSWMYLCTSDGSIELELDSAMSTDWEFCLQSRVEKSQSDNKSRRTRYQFLGLAISKVGAGRNMHGVIHFRNPRPSPRAVCRYLELWNPKAGVTCPRIRSWLDCHALKPLLVVDASALSQSLPTASDPLPLGLDAAISLLWFKSDLGVLATLVMRLVAVPAGATASMFRCTSYPAFNENRTRKTEHGTGGCNVK